MKLQVKENPWDVQVPHNEYDSACDPPPQPPMYGSLSHWTGLIAFAEPNTTGGLLSHHIFGHLYEPSVMYEPISMKITLLLQ